MKERKEVDVVGMDTRLFIAIHGLWMIDVAFDQARLFEIPFITHLLPLH
jgi:hypothetical protein